MDKEYLLLLRMNTPNGEEIVGKLFLGRDADKAYEVFRQLEGEETEASGHFIFFDFIEVENGLPVNLHLLSCNLEQAGCNVKTVLKEFFKSTLEPG